ncbi:Pimeloyl-ACP methyl ester carboxylesterase [Hymenobacter daecheongensis DSM 21074]|uniref:Pimeloyl-ACP methyl ester carboxylesterase n=1 Tax=Hymenobacter daecheongensis DSM 21074 TaxID=1121955 RepID=A0A1M6LI74_9BACT|nr:alpha/beta fold hydrolase [Hymenobacter daecheongensis]SHJ70890.1 Pimeloyl-ACP methyl ester carboxylesterase [Hymenobacter daecheongensis DSM 21074]
MPTQPTLVFLHGFAESREIWSDLLHGFPAHYRVLSLNLLGHGTNIHDVRDYSMEAQARYVAEKMQAAGIEKAVLVGHSMGGYVALAFAERWPERVAGLALINSSAYADNEEKKAARAKNVAFVERHGVEKFMESFIRPLFAPANRETLAARREFLEEIGKATPAETIIGGMQAMAARPDRTKVLREARFPVLLVAGKEDVAVPLEQSVALAPLAPVAHALFLADVGHLAYYERPAETRRAVLELAAGAFGE